MDIMQSIYERARAADKSVALPEATEEKTLQTARICVDESICTPVLVGDEGRIEETARQFGIDLNGIRIQEAFDEAFLDDLIERYVAIRPINSAKTMRRKSKDPLYTALMMQAVGDVDVTFAGISHSTGDVIMAGQMVVGLQEGVSTVSSVGIFNIPGFEGSEGPLLGFGDSAVCTDPDSDMLASIAIAACNTVKALVGWEPRCAMLSFSTDGSGDGPLVDKVVEAVRIANERRPDLAIDGEFQLDSAINPTIAAKKVRRESTVAGKANIVIWPDLNVGNIGVKLVQQFAHADAYGPMLQGFAKVVCDCSRSAPVSEMVGNIAMSCVRA
ncbi:phosphate acetyltransferase [Slackia equolifaciens]|uniref:Phosphate acetyltransferase n=1 Tax=Slackia equolifaciens TaxID=498718 RepID=A0A3N0B4V2_9ACTN|nr:phosphate acyltransferase [Slackia equolifaciens]RNL42153.1 phosphate acetyltransferase [Slackia equolifaciens]